MDDIQHLLGVEFSSPEMIELLLEKGADPNAVIPGFAGTIALNNIQTSKAVHPAALNTILNNFHIERKPLAPSGDRQSATFFIPHPAQRLESLPKPLLALLSKPLPALPPVLSAVSPDLSLKLKSPYPRRGRRYRNRTIANISRATSKLQKLLFCYRTGQAEL